MLGQAINFRYFPAPSWRVPGFYPEFNNSQANTATPTNRALVVGQILAAGTAAAATPLLAYSQAQVNGLAGTNSMLALMYQMYRLQDPFGECWILPIADPAGVAATGTLAFTGPATVAGTLSLYIAGILVAVSVSAGDTATIIAGNVNTAINAAANMPCTSTVSTSTVTLLARHLGTVQNDIDIRLNYRATRNGEVTPAGVSVAITAFAGGTLVPSLTTALANLGQKTFDFIVSPYTDSVSLASFAALLSDQSGRWSAIQGLYGHMFAAYRGTVAARNTFGATNNNQHFSILSFYDSPTPAWLVAADFAGAHAAVLRTNPALGLVGQPLNMLAPGQINIDTAAEMNILLYDGLSTFTVDDSGQCRMGLSVTTYQTNTSGQPDDSYLKTNLMFQAMYVARYLITNVLSQCQNKILVVDGTPIGPGSPAITPTLVFQAVCAMYGYLASQFIVQNPATFAKNGYGQKGAKGQVLLYLPIDFADQVVQVGALIQFVQST